jgi:Tol biopolymer transport system component
VTGLLNRCGCVGIAFAAVALAIPDVGAMNRPRLTAEEKAVAAVRGNGASFDPMISANGRFVVFESLSRALVPGDTNDRADVFVRDRQMNSTARMSVSGRGSQARGFSYGAGISASGRFVGFTSSARNLVRGDTNLSSDVFVRDRLARTTGRVSVSAAGGQATGESDGLRAGITPDGRFVVFMSLAGNLIPGDTNHAWDVFVRDRRSATTERVSVSTGGGQVGNEGSGGFSISVDGRFVVFQSASPSLVNGDTNGALDVFVRDRVEQTTQRVSVALKGAEANGESLSAQISADGRFVVFTSSASNLVSGDTNGIEDVFVRDLVEGATERVSVARAGAQTNEGSEVAAISAAGRFVAFASYASNLVARDTNDARDVFVRDRSAGTTERISMSSAERQGDKDSFSATISADGRFVAFASKASTLVARDTNRATDVFVRDRARGTTTLVSVRR